MRLESICAADRAIEITRALTQQQKPQQQQQKKEEKKKNDLKGKRTHTSPNVGKKEMKMLAMIMTFTKRPRFHMTFFLFALTWKRFSSGASLSRSRALFGPVWPRSVYCVYSRLPFQLYARIHLAGWENTKNVIDVVSILCPTLTNCHFGVVRSTN